MSYTVLARRYRSREFDELVGQEGVARTLRQRGEVAADPRPAHAGSRLEHLREPLAPDVEAVARCGEAALDAAQLQPVRGPVDLGHAASLPFSPWFEESRIGPGDRGTAASAWRIGGGRRRTARDRRWR